MKFRALVGLICCAALFAVPSIAGARAPIPTTITFDETGTVGIGFELLGHLTTPNSKCLANRTVKIFFYRAAARSWSTPT